MCKRDEDLLDNLTENESTLGRGQSQTRCQIVLRDLQLRIMVDQPSKQAQLLPESHG